jgi:hypothetical protein
MKGVGRQGIANSEWNSVEAKKTGIIAHIKWKEKQERTTSRKT